MSDPQNLLSLALISVLEQRAKKKGGKSIVKDVLRVLAERGAGGDLIADVAALNSPRSAPAKAEPADGKSSAGAKAKAGGKPKPAARKKLKMESDSPPS